MFNTYRNIKKGSLICLFFVFIFVSCNTSENKEQVFFAEGNALGTTYHITYKGNEIANLNTDIDSILKVFNYGLSTYDDLSLISQYNRGDSINIEGNAEGFDLLAKMIGKSLPITQATDGAFDPSAAELFGVYSQAKKNAVEMDTLAQRLALEHKGYSNALEVKNDGQVVKQIDFQQFNFNAIAKGYFVDLLMGHLQARGIQNAMVEVGGEVNAIGTNAKNEAWKIGITRPVIGGAYNDFMEVIELSNESMATSGNYQNFYKINGEIVGHTLDPRSGKPVISNLKSATIIHSECAVADAYATACMVLGLEKSIDLIKANPSLKAYFIYEENKELKGIHIP